jgi:hypothetical protein
MKMEHALYAAALCGWLAFAHGSYAFYNPQGGKWINRDPLEETGGNNLYAFNLNNPEDRVDTDGRASITTPAGQVVLYEELLQIIASNMNMPVQQVIRRISLCKALHAAYKALNCKGCGIGCMTRGQAQERAVCLAKEVGLRATYLRLKCDYFLPGSIARGSAIAEKGHQTQLVDKTAALVKCTAMAAP